ncbi:MAG TPA: hypothetical protein VFZ61_03795 [Polyangiales bacterium]
MDKRWNEELSCDLTEDEKNLRAAELALAVVDHDKLEAEKKAWNADWKERKEDNDKRIRRLADARNTGKELRDVECFGRYDPVTQLVNVFRTDTGEKLYSRSAEDHERQLDMYSSGGGHN